MSEKMIKKEETTFDYDKKGEPDREEREPSLTPLDTSIYRPSATIRHVLVIYAGGTIGMTKSADGSLAPKNGHLFDLISKNPTFGHKERSKLSCMYESTTKKTSLPTMSLKWFSDDEDEFYIKYGILEYDPLLDSSNINMEHWMKIASTIYENYADFDGFVILHGTDTMAYTASALSYLLQNLDKCVVFTGSQKPMEQLLTDAIQNFTGALIFAGAYSREIPEVGLFFHNELFRGNRSTKHDASGFDAFSSPNLPSLAKIGVTVKPNSGIIRSNSSKIKPPAIHVYRNMDDGVGAFVLFPGITAVTMQSCLTSVKGAVILTYGAGNGPSENRLLMEVFKKATHRQILLVNITQCLKGEVKASGSMYATGTALQDAGLILGGDMTLEAALTKLSFVIALNMSFEEKKKKLEEDLRGEVTYDKTSGI